MQAAPKPRLEPLLIHYSLELTDLDRHWITVTCHLSDPAADQIFRMPSWIPGSYLLREFARHVIRIEAFAGNEAVAVEKIDKSAWRVEGSHAALTVTIVVHAYDLSVRGAYIDRDRAFFNGTSLFLQPEGRASDPVELRVVRPTQPAASEWRVATAMPASETDERGFGRYTAADYDELIDHPFEISDHARVEFVAAGVPHELVVAGAFNADLDRAASDLRQLCEAQIDFFGRPAPFDSYTFLGLAVGDGYGGLEHRASSSLVFNRNDLPAVGEAGLPKNYQRFLALCSHEYFHSWHIKRTKPAAFVPYRLDRRNHTTLLWVFEGITSYYQERFLLTSGLLGSEAYLRRLSEALTRIFRAPGRFHQSLAQSSFDAWDSLYKPSPSSVNTGVSYYGKGALVALALDLKLRADSNGRVSLDDVVIALWNRFGAAGVGVPEDAFEALACELGGEHLREFFDAAVRGTGDPDLESLFDALGLAFELRPATGPQDLGGTQPALTSPQLSLGAVTQARETGLCLATVPDGGAASSAGLAPGDLLIALDGYVVSDKNLPVLLGRYQAGERVRVEYIRDGLLRATELELAYAPADTCQVTVREDVPEPAVALRKAWLGA